LTKRNEDNIFELSNMYQQLFEHHAELLKAMAHPRRLEILQLLRHEPMNVSQMQEMLSLPQANLSQHLQILRETGVVQTKRSGKEVRYSLANPKFIAACDLMREILVERHQHDELADTLSLDMLQLVPVVTDPVCQMRVSPKTASCSSEFQGTTYYFCASGCQEKFLRKPASYAK
jgi:DNA-binding transcriptional ArsR family regulator/YHS domain-containing protein